MAVKKKLGEMLVEENLLTEEQLKKALSGQEKAGLKLGQCLFQQGIVSEQQIADVLCRQLRLKKYHPDGFPFDLELAGGCPEVSDSTLNEKRTASDSCNDGSSRYQRTGRPGNSHKL